MEIENIKIDKLRELIGSATPKNIVIVAHSNPDGDAIGSSLAWASALENAGHKTQCIVPNKYPYFLEWVEGIESMLIHKEQPELVQKAVDMADIIFCLDFNSLSRLEALGEVIDANTTAQRVLVDHHLSPDENFVLAFSYPDESSTCFIVYSLIVGLWGTEALDKSIGELLYVGMMTDTGNFSFANLSPALYRALAVLSEKGIDITNINSQVYNSFSVDRARLFAYVIDRKLSIIKGSTVAYMTLTEHEMRKYNFQQGDSEGFVNYPLSIKTMKFSVIFIEHRKFIRTSFRSRGNIDVNLFARKYFNGGGHKNAAGGKSFVSMAETVKYFLT